MKITEFSKQIIKRGISRSYNFRMELTIPEKIINNQWWNKYNISSDIGNYLTFQCYSSQFPASNVNIEGGFRSIPVSLSFNNLEMDVRCGKDFMEKKFFDAWHSSIINPENFLISYLDDIKTSLKISKIDGNNNIIYTIKYLDAYPQTVSSIEADQDENKIDTFKVEFHYRKWIII